MSVFHLKGGYINELLAFNLSMFGTTNMNLTTALADPFVYMIMMSVSGGVVAAMLGRK